MTNDHPGCIRMVPSSVRRRNCFLLLILVSVAGCPGTCQKKSTEALSVKVQAAVMEKEIKKGGRTITRFRPDGKTPAEVIVEKDDTVIDRSAVEAAELASFKTEEVKPRPYWHFLLLCLGCAVSGAALGLLVPKLLGWVIRRVGWPFVR